MMTSKRPWLAALVGVAVVVLGAVTVTQLLRAPVDTTPVPRLTPAGAAAIAGRPPAAAIVGRPPAAGPPPAGRIAPAEPPERVPAPAVESGRATVAPGGGDRNGGPDGDRTGGDRNGDDRNGDDRNGDDRAARARDGREDRDRPGRRADPRPPASAPDAAPGGPDPAPGWPVPAPEPAAGAPSPDQPSGPPADPLTGFPARAPGGEVRADPSNETPEQRKARLGRELALSVCDRYGIPRDRCHPPRRSAG